MREVGKRKHTLGGEVAQSSSAVALDLNAVGISQRNEDVKDAEVEKVWLQLLAERQYSDRSGHLRLYGERNPEDQVLALLHSSCLQDKFLVSIGASSKVTERGDSVTLNLFVVG
jgi:hypothetical protein